MDEGMTKRPEEVQLELLYRKTQRQLGEAQVALVLLASLQKANPGDRVFEEAVAKAATAKQVMFKRVLALEQRVFGRTA